MKCQHQMILLIIAVGIRISYQCANWTIVDPPIIFGKTATLGCIAESDNKTSLRTWHGGPHNLPLTLNNVSAIPTKYREVTGHHPFGSMLQIYQFNELDVGCKYACAIGLREDNHRLELNEREFEYHPKENNKATFATLRGGFLTVKSHILKVYPKPIVYAKFKGKTINNASIKVEISQSGKLLKAIIDIDHETKDCKGELVIECVVGQTDVPIFQTQFDTCLGNLQVPPPEYFTSSRGEKDRYTILAVVTVPALLLILMFVAFAYMAKYGLLKTTMCCTNMRWREDPQLRDVVALLQRAYSSNDQQGSFPDPIERLSNINETNKRADEKA